MVKYKWEDLRGDKLPFGGQIAKGARGMFCNLWNKYPDRFTNNDPFTGPGKWYFNTVCQEEDINRQPTPPPFTGGQCTFNYTVRTKAVYLMRSSYSDPGIEVTVQYIMYNVPGPFNLDTQIFLPQGQEFGGSGLRAPRANVKGYADQEWVLISPPDFSQWQLSYNVVRQHKIFSVTPSEGQPDNCGSLPSGWEPKLPTPEPGDETWEVDIPDPGGGPNFGFPLTWVDVDFKLPITLNFEVGDIIIDVGGVAVNFNENNEWNIQDEPDIVKLPEDITNKIEDTKKTVEDTKDVVEEVKENQEEEKKPFDKVEYDSRTFTTETSLDYGDANIIAIEVFVIREPKKGKAIINFVPENTFYWAGYFCWTSNGSRTPHNTVEKSKNFYSKPDWANGFSVFCVNGSKLEVVVYTKKVIPSS